MAPPLSPLTRGPSTSAHVCTFLIMPAHTERRGENRAAPLLRKGTNNILLHLDS